MLYAYAIDLWGDGMATDTEIINGNACIVRKYTPIPIGTDERFDSWNEISFVCDFIHFISIALDCDS